MKPETFDRLARAARRGGPIAFPVALHEGRVAAFSIFLRGPGHVFYWMNASDPALSRLNATTGLLWRAMREACGRRATLFNLGACPDGEEGLARFKESWGSVKTAYPSYHTRWYGILR